MAEFVIFRGSTTAAPDDGAAHSWQSELHKQTWSSQNVALDAGTTLSAAADNQVTNTWAKPKLAPPPLTADEFIAALEDSMHPGSAISKNPKSEQAQQLSTELDLNYKDLSDLSRSLPADIGGVSDDDVELFRRVYKATKEAVDGGSNVQDAQQKAYETSPSYASPPGGLESAAGLTAGMGAAMFLLKSPLAASLGAIPRIALTLGGAILGSETGTAFGEQLAKGRADSDYYADKDRIKRLMSNIGHLEY